jgi:hypothetical protein
MTPESHGRKNVISGIALPHRPGEGRITSASTFILISSLPAKDKIGLRTGVFTGDAGLNMKYSCSYRRGLTGKILNTCRTGLKK